MPDDQNTNQNSIPTENSIPVSPTSFDSAQDLLESPTADTPIQALESSATTPAGVSEADDRQTAPADAEALAGRQIPVNEPFKPVQDKPLPVSTPTKSNQKDLWKRFLDKVQIGKRKKLEKIMTLFENKNGSTDSINSPQASSPQVTNDEVEKLLHAPRFN